MKTFGFGAPTAGSWIVGALVCVLIVLFPTSSVYGQEAGNQDESSNRQKISSLEEVTYVQEAGRPRALFHLDGTAIARIGRETDPENGTSRLIVTDSRSGDIVYTRDISDDTSERLPYICFDALGDMVMDGDSPLLVEPFDVYVSRYPGMAMSSTKMDVYGRLEERHNFLYPCRSATEDNCTTETGNEAVVFVWPM